MEYQIISCDDHLDLNVLPADLWTSRLSPEIRDRAPHIEDRDGKAVWICEDKIWGSWTGRLNGKRYGRTRAGVLNALERGNIIDQSDRRAGVAELRLQDMDRDGVYAHVMYGPITSIDSEDPALRDACYAAYNDWLIEFCSTAPTRLIGVRMLPPDPASAAAELDRLAKQGRTIQANLQIANVTTPLCDPAWEPLWALAEETGILISFHVVAFLGGARATGGITIQQMLSLTKAYPTQFLDPFVDLFAHGILERHPRMRLVLGESGAGWLPWVIQELDHRYDLLVENIDFWESRGGIPLKIRPSEIFRRQVYITFQDDHAAIALVDFFGRENLLWASDYPHPDSTWPYSRDAIQRQMSDLSPEVRRRLLHDNAVKLYGLPLS